MLTAPVHAQNLVPNVSGRFRQPSLSQNNILQGPVQRDNQRHSHSPNIRNITENRNIRVAKVKNSGATPRTVLLPPAIQRTMSGQADSPDTFSAPGKDLYHFFLCTRDVTNLGCNCSRYYQVPREHPEVRRTSADGRGFKPRPSCGS